MDQSAEAVPAHDLTRSHRGKGWERWWVRRQLQEALVRASLMIVAEELPKNALQVPGTEDEDVVQKLPPHRAHPALSEGIGSWSPNGQADDLHALTSEDLVESCGKLRVPVTK